MMGEVDTQLDGLTPELRPVVQRIYDRARERLPGLDQGMSYGMPALMYRGKPLLAVAVWRAWCTVYPYSGVVTARVMAGLDGFEGTKGGIHFTPERPLPTAALDELIAARRAEIDAKLDRTGRSRS